MNTRVIAMRALERVIYRGESLTDVLQHTSITSLDARDQSWVRNLCFGSLRWHGRLGSILRQMLAKPLKKSDKDIECLLRLGLYQLLYQRTPDHAAVNETVAAARKLKKPWAGGLINGVLRGFLRSQEDVLSKADALETAQYSFPPWLAERLKTAWPDNWQNIMQASNQQAPMTLRVNQRKINTAAYQQKLLSKGLVVTNIGPAASMLTLEQALPVSELPGFAAGEVSVQDGAAQLAAELLNCEQGQRVLDACAAPGGKTCHLLECYDDLELLALDSSAKRLQQITENLQRLDLSAKLEAADATDIASWWDEHLYDRILLDAPCSATGVIRRHPDIKLLRKDKDIAQLQQQQQALLQVLWKTLRPGGLLLYATCSVLPEENNRQVARFLLEMTDAEHQHIEANWGCSLSVGRQILPGEQGMDGFYYALLKKAMPDN